MKSGAGGGGGGGGAPPENCKKAPTDGGERPNRGRPGARVRAGAAERFFTPYHVIGEGGGRRGLTQAPPPPPRKVLQRAERFGSERTFGSERAERFFDGMQNGGCAVLDGGIL